MKEIYTKDEVELIIKKAYWAGWLGYCNTNAKLTNSEAGARYANNIVTGEPIYDIMGKLVTEDKYQIIL